MTRPRIVSIVNHKGGCLKTTLTANLGVALARRGKRVLLIDCDMQQNLTQSLIGQVDLVEGVPTLFDALMDESPLDGLIRETPEKGLDIIPCQEDFVGADLGLVSAYGRERILGNCLKHTQRLRDYDIVLLDNPPSVSLVVVNALAASDYFVVPCDAEYLPMVGLAKLGDSVARVQKVAPNLRPLGVIITKFTKTERICNQVATLLRRDLGEMLFDTRIRVNTKAKSAPSVRKSIFEYEDDTQGRGTIDFTDLAEEFLKRIEAYELPTKEKRLAHG